MDEEAGGQVISSRELCPCNLSCSTLTPHSSAPVPLSDKVAIATVPVFDDLLAARFEEVLVCVCLKSMRRHD